MVAEATTILSRRALDGDGHVVLLQAIGHFIPEPDVPLHHYWVSLQSQHSPNDAHASTNALRWLPIKLSRSLRSLQRASSLYVIFHVGTVFHGSLLEFNIATLNCWRFLYITVVEFMKESIRATV